MLFASEALVIGRSPEWPPWTGSPGLLVMSARARPGALDGSAAARTGAWSATLGDLEVIGNLVACELIGPNLDVHHGDLVIGTPPVGPTIDFAAPGAMDPTVVFLNFQHDGDGPNCAFVLAVETMALDPTPVRPPGRADVRDLQRRADHRGMNLRLVRAGSRRS